MPVAPYNAWPREDWEFEPFIKLIHHILQKTTCRVCVMSHQNATDNSGKMIRGNDHRIIEKLLKLADYSLYDNRLFTLSDLYDAAESKTIISTFDILMSGRIHGAVQGLSQGIPTAIIDYGHEPKAHKLKGFAQVVSRLNELLCVIRDSAESMINSFDKVINNGKTRLYAKIYQTLYCLQLNCLLRIISILLNLELMQYRTGKCSKNIRVIIITQGISSLVHPKVQLIV
ncbi:MAG: polysaccharide pyruvyl transferase family protein [bacterium]